MTGDDYDNEAYLRTEVARLKGERDEARDLVKILVGQCRDLNASLAAVHTRIAADETEVEE